MKDKQNINEQVDWDEISTYVSGEMTEKERLDFEEKVSSNPEYSEVIHSSRADLNALDKFHKKEMEFDTKDAWETIDKKIEDWEASKTISIHSRRFRMKHFSRIAAVIFALVALGVSAYLFTTSNDTREFVASMTDQGKIIELPDGTMVELNAGAQISYTRKFKGKERIVHFSGEGFFSVKRDKQKPFVINTSNAKVTVLGTSFNVNTGNDKTEVLVSTGKVSLSALSQAKDNLILETGDLGLLLDDKLSKTRAVNDNYLSWKTQQIIFDETPLMDVFITIEKTYNVEIEIDSDISNDLPLTSTFDKEELRIILESISKTFNLTYVKKDRRIIFTRE